MTRPTFRKSLTVRPESADELLLLLRAYADLQVEHPDVEFEVVLFLRSLRQEKIESVLAAEDSLEASLEVFLEYVDGLA